MSVLDRDALVEQPARRPPRHRRRTRHRRLPPSSQGRPDRRHPRAPGRRLARRRRRRRRRRRSRRRRRRRPRGGRGRKAKDADADDGDDDDDKSDDAGTEPTAKRRRRRRRRGGDAAPTPADGPPRSATTSASQAPLARGRARRRTPRAALGAAAAAAATRERRPRRGQRGRRRRGHDRARRQRVGLHPRRRRGEPSDERRLHLRRPGPPLRARRRRRGRRAGRARRAAPSAIPSLVRVDTINGKPADEVSGGTHFDDLPAGFPAERFELGSDDPTAQGGRVATPFGRGSRVVITGPPARGKTEALRRLAADAGQPRAIEVSLVLAGRAPGGDRRVARSRPGRARRDDQLRRFRDDPAARPSSAPSSTAGAIAARGGDAVVLVDALDDLPPHVRPPRRWPRPATSMTAAR